MWNEGVGGVERNSGEACLCLLITGGGETETETLCCGLAFGRLVPEALVSLKPHTDLFSRQLLLCECLSFCMYGWMDVGVALRMLMC